MLAKDQSVQTQVSQLAASLVLKGRHPAGYQCSKICQSMDSFIWMRELALQVKELRGEVEELSSKRTAAEDELAYCLQQKRHAESELQVGHINGSVAEFAPCVQT